MTQHLRPGQTLATFQSNILQHCCMMLRHVLKRLAKRTQHFQHFQRKIWILCAPGPWHATSGPSAHALVQQCCVNVAKRVQHHTTSEMLREKFDRFQMRSNMLQHIATYRDRAAKRMQHVVPNNVAKCCVEMFQAFGQALNHPTELTKMRISMLAKLWEALSFSELILILYIAVVTI